MERVTIKVTQLDAEILRILNQYQEQVDAERGKLMIERIMELQQVEEQSLETGNYDTLWDALNSVQTENSTAALFCADFASLHRFEDEGGCVNVTMEYGNEDDTVISDDPEATPGEFVN